MSRHDDDAPGRSESSSWLVGGGAPPALESCTGRRAGGAKTSAAIRLSELLEAGPKAVSKLSTAMLHRLVNEIGLHDALELLELFEPRQVRELFDLQVWQHDRVDLDELLDWTYALTCLDDDRRRAHLGGLDVELLAFLLRTRAHIYLTQDEEEPPCDEPEGVFYGTPDGWFVLDLLVDTETELQQLIALLDALYQDDPEHTRSLLQNVMWELPSELEEWSLRWRNGRLQDLGFADPLESLAVYAYLDPSSVRPDEATGDAPLRADPEPTGEADRDALIATDGEEETFWSRGLALVDEPRELERLSQAMMFLANRTLAADRIEPSDAEGVAGSLRGLRGRLSLGLERLCGGDLAHATKTLQKVALLRIARLGHSLVVDVGRPLVPLARQRRLGRQPRRLDLLPASLERRLNLVLSPRPSFAKAEPPRPFASARDLEVARGWVAEGELTAALVPPSRWPARLTPNLTLPDIFCTRVAEVVLGGAAPFDEAALRALCVHLVDRSPEGLDGSSDGPGFDEVVLCEARRQVDATLDGASAERVAAGQALGARWVADLARGLAALDRDGPLDLRFINGLQLQRELDENQ